ncbi:hypothetical protein PIB30_052799 [Stylosanthes scabra]|uniref:Histone chaperone domain-containing protein n=1 Tax=Stylosanthes scabra TaxID=79078 RepID=A0ABU6VJB1_9FABA|nr:hypothetical protein [Stylosanthes scabra]
MLRAPYVSEKEPGYDCDAPKEVGANVATTQEPKEGECQSKEETEIIREVERTKKRDRNFEGIDLSNIISSPPERSGTTFPSRPPPEPKVPDEINRNDVNDSGNANIDNEEDEENQDNTTCISDCLPEPGYDGDAPKEVGANVATTQEPKQGECQSKEVTEITKERDRNFEGIDLSNIISSLPKRSRTTFSSRPPPESKVPDEINRNDVNDSGNVNNDNEEDEESQDNTGKRIPSKIKTAKLTEEDKKIIKEFENETKKFLCATTSSKIPRSHLPAILNISNISKKNWAERVHSFLLNGIKTYRLRNNKSVDGCLYALMIIYFHELEEFEKKPAESSTRQPWIHHWTRKRIQKRVAIESKHATGLIVQAKMKDDKKKGKTQKKKRVVQDEIEIDSDYENVADQEQTRKGEARKKQKRSNSLQISKQRKASHEGMKEQYKLKRKQLRSLKIIFHNALLEIDL